MPGVNSPSELAYASTLQRNCILVVPLTFNPGITNRSNLVDDVVVTEYETYGAEAITKLALELVFCHLFCTLLTVDKPLKF